MDHSTTILKQAASLAMMLLLPLMVMVSCKKDPPPNPYDDPSLQPPPEDTTGTDVDPESFVGLHYNIFRPTCANSGCHDGTFEPDFRTIESSYNTLVYHTLIKNDVGATFTYRVLPGNADMSVLYQRLTIDIDGQSGIMPLALEPTSDWPANKTQYIENIRTWINNGAKDQFGNPPTLGNLEPQMQGVVAFATGPDPLDRGAGKSAIQVPPGTNSMDIWISLSDAETNASNLTHNKIMFSEKILDFSNATEESLQVVSPITEDGYFDEPVPFTHKITINPSNWPVGSQVFFRVYVQDNVNDITEIPENGSFDYILEYFSFKVN